MGDKGAGPNLPPQPESARSLWRLGNNPLPPGTQGTSAPILPGMLRGVPRGTGGWTDAGEAARLQLLAGGTGVQMAPSGSHELS